MAASDFSNTGAPVNPFTSWSNGSVTRNGGKCVMQKKSNGQLVMASCVLQRRNGQLVMASCTMSRRNGQLVMASCTLQNN
ncbi:hypothetical protein KCU71_g10511, partial [Aureobasidium melanogenum]